MGLGSTIRNAVAVAHRITGGTDGLQATVSYKAWTGYDANAKPTFATAVSKTAIVDYSSEYVRDITGNQVVARALVQFLTPFTANGATGRREPIDPRDEIVLPDGSTGTIVAIKGVVDDDTDAPYAAEVWIG